MEHATSRIAREAGPAVVTLPREAGRDSRAAPATVTGEPRSTTPLARILRDLPGRRGAAAIREPGDLAATVVRPPGGVHRKPAERRVTRRSRHERHRRSWREICVSSL